MSKQHVFQLISAVTSLCIKSAKHVIPLLRSMCRGQTSEPVTTYNWWINSIRFLFPLSALQEFQHTFWIILLSQINHSREKANQTLKLNCLKEWNARDILFWRHVGCITEWTAVHIGYCLYMELYLCMFACLHVYWNKIQWMYHTLRQSPFTNIWDLPMTVYSLRFKQYNFNI